MKIAMVTDTHFGVRKGSPEFLESQLRFFKNQFFPYLEKNNIDTIIHLGDFWDNRNFLETNTLNEIDTLMVDYFNKYNSYFLVGNHDTKFKTNIDINSLKMFRHLPNIHIIDDIEKINIHVTDILMVPWQVDNQDFINRVVNKNIKTDICVGHFETIGFHFNKGQLCEHGLNSRVLFDSYKLIFSGHFHKRKIDF